MHFYFKDKCTVMMGKKKEKNVLVITRKCAKFLFRFTKHILCDDCPVSYLLTLKKYWSYLHFWQNDAIVAQNYWPVTRSDDGT